MTVIWSFFPLLQYLIKNMSHFYLYKKSFFLNIKLLNIKAILAVKKKSKNFLYQVPWIELERERKKYSLIRKYNKHELINS